MNNVRLKDIVELACRLYVFIFLNVYGIGKILGAQFYTPKRIPPEIASIPLGQVQSFELAWTFMGHSYAYILFIGCSQLIGAWLLLSHKFKLIGVMILIPIMVNVIVFDIIFLDAYGALGSAVIYFIMLLIILLINKDKILLAVKDLTAFSISDKTTVKSRLTRMGIAVLIMALLFAVDQLIVNLLGHGKG